MPIPTGSGDADAEEFLDDVKNKVLTAIDNARQAVEARRAQEANAQPSTDLKGRKTGR